MKKEATGKELINRFLDRIAITARISVENGEYSKDEILEYIKTYGDKKITEMLDMDDDMFNSVATLELLKSGVEIPEMDSAESDILC